MTDPSHDAVFHEDPYRVLEVAPNAVESEIRQAYLRKVKEHPPEEDSRGFERIRDAYMSLRDPRGRVRRLLLETDPEAPIASLLDAAEVQRRFVGPDPWLAALKES